METLTGTELNGRYRVEMRIGAGGAATVYLGYDLVLERPIAIKILYREPATAPGQLERFLHEARAAAQLSHPNIVGVIDSGQDADRQYIIFEYVAGETLKERIRRQGALPIDEAIAYAIDITHALGAAHAHHIIHRDIKPQNALIDEEGRLKVTDFGIAYRAGADDLAHNQGILGSTDYVSPEQALNHTVNHQTDIYSLGIVLFEMLAGAVPFQAESSIAVAMKHVNAEFPDIEHHRPEVSATLAAVVDRMVAKNVTHRYQNTGTLAVDLEDALVVETARAEHSSTNATTAVLALPEPQKRRLPLLVRRHVSRATLFAGIALVGGGLLVGITEGLKRTRSSSQTDSSAGAPRVSVKSISAHDYDPLGDGAEHPAQTHLVFDRNPSTQWTTDRYYDGKLNKPGVGLYVNVQPSVVASEIEIQTPNPGWKASIYAATNGPPETVPSGDWKLVGGGTVEEPSHRFTLNATDKPYRYYLVWVTELPPSQQRVEISGIVLFRPKMTSQAAKRSTYEA